MSTSILRLLSFVAFAAVLPLLGLYGVLMMAATPNSIGGMEPIMATICYVFFTCVFGALIIIAVNFSRQLAGEAKGKRYLP